ncbi:MAG: PD40 domain-containing protein [Betaproteobacteria bacterium]|nr:PD40 domain-containing protein [Betaproteobacteria bacterium]
MTAHDSAPGHHRSPFTLGAFRVQPESNELSGPGGVVRLRPILMDLLVRLARDPGKPVAREALIGDVWPRRMVNDEVLSRAVAELRTALGDSTREPRYIETLPKVGYRLVAVVGDLAPVLEGALAASGPEADTAVPTVSLPNVVQARSRKSWLVGGLAVAGVVTAGAVFHWRGAIPALSSSGNTEGAIEKQLAAATNFTADVGQEQFPRFSPDGGSVAFTLRSIAEGGAKSRVVLQDTASRRRTVLESGAADTAAPVFHPDGKRIAYYRLARGDGMCGIVLRDLSSSQEELLVDCKQRPRVVFDWSPDGKWLVFSAPPAADMPAGLSLLEIATRRIQKLTGGTPGEGQDTAPRYDRTGQRIAFMRGTDSHREIWVLDVANPQGARRIGPTEGQVYGMAWLDAGRLLVSADWHGARALNVLDIGTGEARLAGARGARYPDVSATGALAYEGAAYRADLWESDTRAPGRDARLLWPSTRYTNQAEYAPDGRRVVFASNRDGADHLYVAEHGAEPQRLALTAGYRYIRPHWSRDGQRIHATRIGGGTGKLSYEGIVFDLATQRETVLTALGAAVADVREWDDRGALLVGENERHAFRLSVVDGNGTRTRLALPLVSHYGFRGSRLAYSLPQLQGLTVCETPALRCERKDMPISDANRFDWTLDNVAVWYRGRGADGKPRLVRELLAGGQKVEFDAVPTAAGSNIAVNPAGDRMLIAREADPLIDVYLSPPRNGKP